jgi:hypothetical protein
MRRFFIPGPILLDIQTKSKQSKAESFQRRTSLGSLERDYLFSGPPGGGQKFFAFNTETGWPSARIFSPVSENFFSMPHRKKRREIQGGGG